MRFVYLISVLFLLGAGCARSEPSALPPAPLEDEEVTDIEIDEEEQRESRMPMPLIEQDELPPPNLEELTPAPRPHS